MSSPCIFGYNSIHLQEGKRMKDFGLHIWGDDNFSVQDGRVNINHANTPSLLEITQAVREKGYKGPLLLRFPHLIKKQISTLFEAFAQAKKSFDYQGDFQAVFPLKVNQFPNFIHALMDVSKTYNYRIRYRMVSRSNYCWWNKYTRSY